MSVKTEKYYLFWRSKFGQWHMSDMFDPITGLTFNCAEQFMMYKKAELFGDNDIMNKIMASNDPRTQKNLGREVKGYDEDKWNDVAVEIVAYGNYLKFTQNPKLLKLMYKHKDRILVEASPIDKKWGIGLAEENPDALDESKWQGENLLGKALMNARVMILQTYSYQKCLETYICNSDNRQNILKCPKCDGTGVETIYDHDCWGKPDGSHDIVCYKCEGKGNE